MAEPSAADQPAAAAEPRVRDVMDANPVTVAPDTDVRTVIRTLRDHELPGVPVVNAAGRCVGIVTERDLILADEEGDLHLPHYLEIFGGVVFLPDALQRFEERLRKAVASSAEEMMTADPVDVGPDAGVREAARIISESGHNRLPVTEHGRFVGVVTRVDVLGALTR